MSSLTLITQTKLFYRRHESSANPYHPDQTCERTICSTSRTTECRNGRKCEFTCRVFLPTSFQVVPIYKQCFPLHRTMPPRLVETRNFVVAADVNTSPITTSLVMIYWHRPLCRMSPFTARCFLYQEHLFMDSRALLGWLLNKVFNTSASLKPYWAESSSTITRTFGRRWCHSYQSIYGVEDGGDIRRKPGRLHS